MIIRDGAGVDTEFRNGVDVDRMELQRTRTPYGGTIWILDFMYGDVSRARVMGPPWDFDRDHGPKQGAEVSGLPLLDRNTEYTGRSVQIVPRMHSRLLGLLVIPVFIAVLTMLVCLLIPPLREKAWVWAGLAAMCLPFLVASWWPLPRRGSIVFRPRPAGKVAWIFRAKAAIEHIDDLVLVRTGGRTISLPGTDDACGARELRRVSGSARQVTLVALADSGHGLVKFRRSEWCSDGSEPELAAALGAQWDPEPIDNIDVVLGVATTRGPSPRHNASISLALTVGSLPGTLGVIAVAGSASGSGSAVAVILGAAGTLLGLVGPVAEIAWQQLGAVRVSPTQD